MFIKKTDIKTNSYIGGDPMLPSGFEHPKSKNNIELTFFFTIEFSEPHPFSGYSLSFFSATAEFDENLTIPRMLNSNLKGAVIPTGFLKDYQELFKVYLFKTETAETQKTKLPSIKKQYLAFSSSEDGDIFGWAGPSPDWTLEDEAPSTYEGETVNFIFQVKKDQTFEILEGAPPQKEMDIFGGVKDRKKRNYTFFNQNESFFFGRTSDKVDNNVYIITQYD
ncbi:DUF1963 domain-containing protein [Pseudomonas sp. MAFF 730085]|uniref:DUF1963 domain-containing protein n=1 Tax=Pseudomonas kitaguniensis TaxID=2607908 RepID=A0A5N7JNZ7_9PSED|nr:DUF1963 domain-containing protein [Pseudomonas kitaguniensis]MPQ83118.1 DUF1963 domain-containing protein [Pseudomonas kitaguniensis]